jgi:hypothetical protein
MVKIKDMETKNAASAEADMRTWQALDQAAGGSGDFDAVAPGTEAPEAKFAYAEPGTDDARSADTPDCDEERRRAEAVRASQPREHYTTRNAAMLAIGGLAGFLLHGVLAGR